MVICTRCQGILRGIIENEYHEYVLFSDACEMPTSALQCPSCAIIMEAVRQNHADDVFESTSGDWKGRDFENHLQRDRVLLRGEVASCFTIKPSNGDIHFSGVNVVLYSGCGELRGYLGLYENPDNDGPSLSEIGGKSPAHDSGNPEALSTVKSWVKTCTQTHLGCRARFASIDPIDENIPPTLPTRVIEIEEDRNSNHVRLLEANGLHANYVTLSHCWGPQENRPLTTTKANLQNRLEGISWNSLPKSFQDAVIVTRDVGFRYLWIDALCILQDDDDDWHRESACMGLIYENATFTISASGAADASEGCFMSRPMSTVNIPYMVGTSNHSNACLAIPDLSQTEASEKTSFFADLEFPDLRPLSSRAWVTQEWELSRRIVHFRKGMMIWSCKTIACTEDNRCVRTLLVDKIPEHHSMQAQRESFSTEELYSKVLRLARSRIWRAIVEDYSSRNLTFNKDRLIALQGISNEIQRRWPDLVYAEGLWLDSMNAQLFWHGLPGSCLSRPNELADMFPTWSWASTLGRVKFLDVKYLDGYESEPVLTCRNLTVESNKELVVIGRIKSLGVRRPHPRGSDILEFQKMKASWSGYGFRQSAKQPKARPKTRPGFRTYPLVAPSIVDVFDHIDKDNSTLGSAILDDTHMPKGPIFCTSISGNKKFARYPDRVPTVYEINVLLLLKNDGVGDADTYRRIGVGRIINWKWFDDVADEEIRII